MKADTGTLFRSAGSLVAAVSSVSKVQAGVPPSPPTRNQSTAKLPFAPSAKATENHIVEPFHSFSLERSKVYSVKSLSGWIGMLSLRAAVPWPSPRKCQNSVEFCPSLAFFMRKLIVF